MNSLPKPGDLFQAQYLMNLYANPYNFRVLTYVDQNDLLMVIERRDDRVLVLAGTKVGFIYNQILIKNFKLVVQLS